MRRRRASAVPAGVPMTLLVFDPVVAPAIGWRATRRSSSPSTGLQCVGLAALVAGFGLFLLSVGQSVIFAGRPYDAGMVRDFRASAAPDLATYAGRQDHGAGHGRLDNERFHAQGRVEDPVPSMSSRS
jgi:hypothetical protein